MAGPQAADPCVPRSRRTHDRLDHTLRTVLLLPATIALCLYAVDMARYAYNSSRSHDVYITVGILGIIFLSLSILRFLWATVKTIWQSPPPALPRYTAPWQTVVLDTMFFMVIHGVADTTLSMRSSSTDCDRYVYGCSPWLISSNKAAGAFALVTSYVFVPDHPVSLRDAVATMRHRVLTACTGSSTTSSSPSLSTRGSVRGAHGTARWTWEDVKPPLSAYPAQATRVHHRCCCYTSTRRVQGSLSEQKEYLYI